ncbi:hypothetical protein V8E36_002242 [Tilletia maclaganii]
MLPPSPTPSAASSTGSRRSSVAGSIRSTASRRGGPPPLKPQKPVHLTVRAKTSPYDADTLKHAHWDSQATIRGASAAVQLPIRPMDTGASAADSFSSYTHSVHSREPSLLLPDETGMGSAGFLIASPPSGFLHQHNAHAIATASAAAVASPPRSHVTAQHEGHDTIKATKSAPARRFTFENDDDGDSDGIEDIDSFLGDDTPQQALSSPRRSSAAAVSKPSVAASPPSQAPEAVAAAVPSSPPSPPPPPRPASPPPPPSASAPDEAGSAPVEPPLVVEISSSPTLSAPSPRPSPPPSPPPLPLQSDIAATEAGTAAAAATTAEAEAPQPSSSPPTSSPPSPFAPPPPSSPPSPAWSGARFSDSFALPGSLPYVNATEIRQPAPVEPLSASTSAIATSVPASSATSSKPGYLASLLSFGGKSFNRFGPFVTSGAEEWILCTEAGAGIEPPQNADSSWDNDCSGGENDAEYGYGNGATWGRGTQRSVPDLSALTLPSLSRSSRHSRTEIAQHMVISGPAGPRWKARSPPFHVEVHSPKKKKKLNGMHEYTLYTVTSTYSPPELQGPSPRRQRSGSAGFDHGESQSDPEMAYAMPYDPTVPPQPAGHTLTVLRRFTQFAWLSRVLSTRYPALVLPPLPSKQYAGRFSAEFIETRRADLDLWLGRVVRHPVARYEEAVIFFLSEDDEAEWKRREAEFEAVPKVEIVSGIGPTGAYSTIGRRGAPLSVANGFVNFSSAANAAAGPKSVVVLEGAPTFFASTFHPDFNLDVTDAAAEARSLERFAEAYERAMMLEPGGGLGGGLSGSGGSGVDGGHRLAPGGGNALIGMSASAIADSAGPNAVPPKGYPAAGAVGVLPAWRGLRETNALQANSYRDLSFSLLRLITGRGLGMADDHAPPPGTQAHGPLGTGTSSGPRTPDLRAPGHHGMHGPPLGGMGKRPATGASNEEGGWCWREGCTECVALTKSLQYVAQSLQHVADEYDEHTRVALMRQHERLKGIGRPRLSIDKLLDVHHSTTLKYREATGEAVEDGDSGGGAATRGGMSSLTQTERELMAARCETVLNVTMSEIDRIHQERTEDWTAWARHWLDDEIAHHERCLETLRNARTAFESDSWEFYAREGPVIPTPHDQELYSTRRSAFPIPMPSAPYAPPGMKDAAMRPVSLASEVVREGVTKFTYLFSSNTSAPAASSSAAEHHGFAGDRFTTRPALNVAYSDSKVLHHEAAQTRLSAHDSTLAGIAASPSALAWPGAKQLLTLRAEQAEGAPLPQQQQQHYQPPQQQQHHHHHQAQAHRNHGQPRAVPSASSIFTSWR